MKEWIESSSDMVFGSIVLFFFLVFIFALGKVIYTFKNARFTKAWSPLVPIINGTVVGDGGGGSTSWLTGTWQGRRVRAIMSPDRNRYSGESGSRYNEFGIELLDVPGGQDWRIENSRVEMAEPALRQQIGGFRHPPHDPGVRNADGLVQPGAENAFVQRGRGIEMDSDPRTLRGGAGAAAAAREGERGSQSRLMKEPPAPAS